MDVYDLASAFRSKAYQPSAELGSDGWPAARRRQLLKRYLAGKNIPFKEVQKPFRGKYTDTRIVVRGRAEGSIMVPLILRASGYAEQAVCDEKLFAFLDALPRYLNLYGRLEFAESDSCSGLTGHRAAGE